MFQLRAAKQVNSLSGSFIRTQSKFDCLSESEGATPNFRLTRLLVPGSKTPLEKSLSMPDMQNKTKKRERLMA